MRLLEQSSLRRNVENFSYVLEECVLENRRERHDGHSGSGSTVASLPRILRFRRVPEAIEAILSAVSRHRPEFAAAPRTVW